MMKIFVSVFFWIFMTVVMPVAHCASVPTAPSTPTTPPNTDCTLPNGNVLHDTQHDGISCDGLPNAYLCQAYCDNGTLIRGIEWCNTGDYFLHERVTGVSSSLIIFKYCLDKQAACNLPDSLNSGARWNDNVGNGICDCGDTGKLWNPISKMCEISPEKQACDAKSGVAYWEYIAGDCRCREVSKYWNGSDCADLVSKQQCDAMAGNSNFDGDVEWNAATNTCDCIKDAANNEILVANRNDYRIGVFGCEKKPSVLRREEYQANLPQANAVQDQINDIIGELKTISDGWGQSRWKTASGNFNGARLASDSIAGVVLGTVGGVVTSNVIKKNQVKGGFEDIKCTIGGQNVAGYADQFRVGVQ